MGSYPVVIRYKVLRLRPTGRTSRARQRVGGLAAVCAPDAAIGRTGRATKSLVAPVAAIDEEVGER